MTTTKEDQINAAYEKARPELGGYADVVSFEYGWKARAESYEKKLADLKDSFAEIQHNQFTLINDYKQQLSTANARNAMLIDALKTCVENIESGDKFFNANKVEAAISANSEAVATLEGEKLRAFNKGKGIV